VFLILNVGKTRKLGKYAPAGDLNAKDFRLLMGVAVMQGRCAEAVFHGDGKVHGGVCQAWGAAEVPPDMHVTLTQETGVCRSTGVLLINYLWGRVRRGMGKLGSACKLNTNFVNLGEKQTFEASL
jgi:hypothetical protein